MTKPSPSKKYMILSFLLCVLTVLSSIGTFNPVLSTENGTEDASFNVDVESIISQLPLESYDEEELERLWLEKDYEMLLILPSNATLVSEGEDPDEWHTIAQDYAKWRNFRGIPALIVSNHSDYPGVDGPEKIRNSIISYYEKYPIEWVLLMGSTDLIPNRYVYNPDTVEFSINEPVGGSTLKPTDFYYADLTGNWDIDGDGRWGEYADNVQPQNVSEGDFNAEVYVGRFPVETSHELGVMYNKTLIYEKAENPGQWMNRYLSVSAISDFPNSKDLDGEDEAQLNQFVIDSYIDKEMDWVHLMEYTSKYTRPSHIDPVTGNDRVVDLYNGAMKSYLDLGPSISVFAGHGSPSSFDTYTVGNALNINDVQSLNNGNNLTFIYASACSTNAYDYNSLGENFVKKENGGGIGFVGSMRISWYYPNDTYFQAVNRGQTRLFFHEMFQNGNYQQGKALYESKRNYINEEWFQSSSSQRFPLVERKNLFSYMLLGDPSIYINTEIAQEFDSLLDHDTQVYASGTTTLIIRDKLGNPVKHAYLTLFNEDGYYNTFNSDHNGRVKIQFPNVTGLFNYSIFAHNMVYETGQFSVIRDTQSPQFINPLFYTPTSPSVHDNIDVSISVEDKDSGVNHVFLIMSQTNFEEFDYYEMSLQSIEYNNYEVILPKLPFDEYSIGIIAIDRTYNYNSTFNQEDTIIQFSIPVPVKKYVYDGLNLISIFSLFSIVIIFSKKYAKGKYITECVFLDVCE